MRVQISFKIHYVTNYGEAVYISGSSQQLGEWEVNKAKRLTWNENNLWSVQIDDFEETTFDYKFFISSYDNPLLENSRWEQGPNRTINLMRCNLSQIEISDVWEFKKVILRLFCCSQIAPNSQLKDECFPNKPELQNDQEKYLNSQTVKFYVTGSSDSMGNLLKLKKMKRRTALSANSFNEIKEIIFWEKEFLIKSSQQNLKYKYAYKSEDRVNDQFQRKSKYLNFSKNDVNYQGAFCISDEWIPEEFSFDSITPNIFLGPYLENTEQIKQLADAGVKVVFNLQTKEDMELHYINWENIQKIYESYGIKIIHYPINDMDVFDMVLKFDCAVTSFKQAVDNYQNVYIHCTSGIYRSAQILIAFLHLYSGMSIKEAIFLVERKRPITKRNREYLRQIYMLKGGYSSPKKQQKGNPMALIEARGKSTLQQQISQKVTSSSKILTSHRRNVKSWSSQSSSCIENSLEFIKSKVSTLFFSEQPTTRFNKNRSSFANSYQLEEKKRLIRI